MKAFKGFARVRDFDIGNAEAVTGNGTVKPSESPRNQAISTDRGYYMGIWQSKLYLYANV